MPHVNAYESEPYRTELQVNVLQTGSGPEGAFAVIDDTILYPGGGGQPPDLGTLAGVPVVASVGVDSGVRLTLEAVVEPGPALLTLDWRRRFDHMQQHTAQHLITALASDRFGWPTTSFHLGEGLCDIELDVASVPERRMHELEDEVMALVRAAVPVTARRVSLVDYEGMEVRSRGLPAGHEGDVRLVEIEGVDTATCGGTHLASTAEIEAVCLLSTEAMRGGTRLHWIAGGRVRGRLYRAETRLAGLRRVLGVADDALAEAAEGRQEQLKSALKKLRALEGQVAVALAHRLAQEAGPVVAAHAEDADPGYLQLVARAFAPLGDGRVGVLTADGAKGPCFLVVAAEAFAGDVQSVGRAVADALGGRGGGSGAIFQGRAESLASRTEALDRVRAIVEKGQAP